MKRILTAIIIAITALSANSCRIIDYTPINLRVQVQDSEGKDLLDPANDNSWLLGTTITFRGIVVELDETNITVPETKEYGPVEYQGFRLEKMSDCWELVFGEFDGGDEYDDSFFISWPDKKYSVIDYSRKINSMSGNVRQTWTLNGKECNNPVVIVR